MSGVGLTIPARRARARSRSSMVTLSGLAALIGFAIRAARGPRSIPMLMRRKAALARGAEGIPVEFDLHAFAGAPVEIEQQVAHRAPLDCLDQRGDLRLVGGIDRRGLGG